MFIGFFGDNDIYKITAFEHGENLRTIMTKLCEKIETVIYFPGIKTLNESHNSKYKKYISEEKLSTLNLKNLHLLNLFESYKQFNLKKFFTIKLIKGEEFLNNGKNGDFDAFHPNAIGNAYIAKLLLESQFNIKFDPEKFIASINYFTKYPILN